MDKRRRIVFGLALGACVMALGGAGPAKKLAIPFVQSGDEIRRELSLTGTSGWYLVDIDTGQVIDRSNADRGFAPASVAKLPTAAFALDALGPDHRFVTQVLAGGPLKNGQITGDLVLQGGGDPELDTDALLPLVNAVRAKGVRNVTGGVLVDGTALPQVTEIEPTQGVDASYNPAVSGLNLNYNRVHFKWDARKGRRRIAVEAEAETLSPAVDGVRVAVAGRPGAPQFSFRQQGGRELWEISQEAFRGAAARWLPVKRPDLYAAEVFRGLARDQGIKMGAISQGAARGGPVLARHQSRPLGEILRDMLRFSTNLTAEVTGTSATRATGSTARSLSDSAAIMNAWAASVAGFPGNDPGFRFVNHSGLTLDSRVSPRRMVELLSALARRAADPGRRHGRLPGGIAGYLKNHNVVAKSFPLDYDRLAVVAKTGTINYVRGLAGYIATPSGRRMAFAIFSNDLPRRGLGAQKINRRWMGRAKGFERALIRNWVLKVDGRG